MDRIFMRGINTREEIENDLHDYFNSKKCHISDINIIQIKEGQDLDFDMKRFKSISELSDLIVGCIEDPGQFESAFVMSNEKAVIYLMFAKTNDMALADALSMVR